MNDIPSDMGTLLELFDEDNISKQIRITFKFINFHCR
jgi:hypothetical protein